MISFINNALKHRNGEKGFSLVELIVVVAILGILVVIAIPVFGAIQTTARQNTVATAAANAATSLAAQIAVDGPNAVSPTLEQLNAQGNEIRYAVPNTVGFNDHPANTASAVSAANNSVDTVYVYAANERNEWAGSGSAGPAQNSWTNN